MQTRTNTTEVTWLRVRLERLAGPIGDRLHLMRDARRRYTASIESAPERYLVAELNILNANVHGPVDRMVESGYFVDDRRDIANYLTRQALTVTGWPVIAMHYRAMAEQAPIVCDFADDLDLMRRLVLDCVARCPECFGTERGESRGPGVLCFKENGELVPRPEPDLDEATLLRARAGRLLRQRQEAASENEADLGSLAEEGGSNELIAELRRVQEQWVTPANTLLGERSLGGDERAVIKALVEEVAPTAEMWPALADRYATLAKGHPGLCIAFDRADLLRRLLIEIVELPEG